MLSEFAEYKWGIRNVDFSFLLYSILFYFYFILLTINQENAQR